MKTIELMDALGAHLPRALRFRLPDGDTVPGNFHITKIEAVRRRGMDCGGNLDESRETVVQLLAGKSGVPMTAGRAVSIFQKLVDAPTEKDFDLQAELIIEYDRDGDQLARFPVGDAEVSQDGLLEIRLETLASVCAPARDRTGAAACCR
ncbi:MAG: DUF6428 family protein [bacterium]|nr:DUF6428 family protein [bacterium]